MKMLLVTLSLVFSASSFAQQMSSAYTCEAYTVCPNGGVVTCTVYGSQYVNSYGGAVQQSNCSWFVQPYQAVRCAGWQAEEDMYGRMIWGWVDSGYLSCY